MTEIVAAAGPNWYVVQTKPKQEFRALEQLENQRFRCFLPSLKVEKLRRGKLEIVTEPLFPRYLFIHLDTVSDNWAPLRSTRGVSKLIEFGGRFAIVPALVIDALQDWNNLPPKQIFEAGETVGIASGPFEGLKGIYQMLDGEARAIILIELISQPQRLSFQLKALRKAV